MANTFSPFGFQQYLGGAGGAPTFAQQTRRIASTSGAIYFGDPVAWTIGAANGYIVQAVAGGSAAVSPVLAGIFVGCKYQSNAMKRTIWSNFWPGSDTSYDVEAYVIDDPNAQFVVQTSGAAFYNASWTSSIQNSLPIGQYAQFSVGTGNVANGVSGSYLSSVGTTATLPFVIQGYVTNPPGQNGTDPTTNYPYAIVGFNNEIRRTNGAGPTGIS